MAAAPLHLEREQRGKVALPVGRDRLLHEVLARAALDRVRDRVRVQDLRQRDVDLSQRRADRRLAPATLVLELPQVLLATARLGAARAGFPADVLLLDPPRLLEQQAAQAQHALRRIVVLVREVGLDAVARAEAVGQVLLDRRRALALLDAVLGLRPRIAKADRVLVGRDDPERLVAEVEQQAAQRVLLRALEGQPRARRRQLAREVDATPRELLLDRRDALVEAAQQHLEPFARVLGLALERDHALREPVEQALVRGQHAPRARADHQRRRSAARPGRLALEAADEAAAGRLGHRGIVAARRTKDAPRATRGWYARNGRASSRERAGGAGAPAVAAVAAARVPAGLHRRLDRR